MFVPLNVPNSKPRSFRDSSATLGGGLLPRGGNFTSEPTGVGMRGKYTFGIEEEYFLVDAETKLVARAMPEAFLSAAKTTTNGQVRGEFLQSQIEVTTLPHHDIRTAHAELRHLRQTVAKIAAEHGLAILAAGTHPTADWGKSQQSEGERYDAVMDDLQMIGQRNMLCGLHVHVELPDPDDRVDVMTRMLPYLPLFIALATSSPFWRSRPTGLKGYRLAAYDELPRTGVPELFRNKEEFDAYVAALVKAGVMQDSSYVWWSMRPSLKHPTLELRAPDCPTLVDDSIAIAALWRSLALRLTRNPQLNRDIDAVKRAIIVENKWRAQRYGVHGTLVGDDGAITVADFTKQVLEETAADAEELGCRPEMERCRTIVGAGTSADAQMAVYEAHGKKEGRAQALSAVTDWLAIATLQ
jgi:carboxylate-amine ligase